ncbi:hypothetical protein HP532_29410 [Pseudomonas sp. CrR25]|nr:hypothetical protein [Pseudomonas sp. CrR25]
MNALLVVPLIAVLGGAVCTDVRSHRIPNVLLILGLVGSVALQIFLSQVHGMFAWLGGLVVGLLCFLPLYIFGGMAAGDVKLMAVVGSFLGPEAAFWAAAFSLITGGALGILILLYRHQLGRFIQRYWAIASLRAYIQPEADDAARQRFPYAIAILLGTLISIFWQPFGQ